MKARASFGFLIVVSVLAAGCAGPATETDDDENAALAVPAREPDGVLEDTVLIEHNTFLFPSFGSPSAVRARATFEVVEGSPIDVWMGTMEECQQYGRPSYAPRAAALGRLTGTLVADFPPGDNCLVLDNTDFAEGEARAEGDVRVHYRIEVWALGPEDAPHSR